MIGDLIVESEVLMVIKVGFFILMGCLGEYIEGGILVCWFVFGMEV